MRSHAKVIALCFGLLLLGFGCDPRARVPQVVGTPQPQPEAPVVPAPVVLPSPTPTTPPPPVVPTPPPPAAPSPNHTVKVLKVPFTPQAPYANWSQPYQDACEETSAIMVGEFFRGQRMMELDPAYADKEILALVAFEQEKFGYYRDTTALETAQVITAYYGLKAEVVPYDPEVIRQAILAQHPVILPLAGQSLGNPYYTPPGPPYHMLVVKGYQGGEFITNDPGTRRGESYRYTEEVLGGAVHDWNNGDVERGDRVMIVVSAR